MGQVDVAWPSEDEDFDAKIDSATISKTKSKVAGATVERETTAVEVSEPETDSEEPTEQTEEAEPETPEQPEEAAPEQAAEEPEAAPEAEEKESEPEAVPEPPPEETSVPAAAEQFAPPPKQPKVKGKMSSMPSWRLIVDGVLILAVIGLGLWSWSLYSDRKDLKQQVAQLNANPQVAVQKQTQTLINQVSHLMQLPTGETPTVANVTDAAQAKQQSAFFNNAQNGDKVLMYVKAGEAILYRPSTDKIILVAPLTFTGNSSSTTTK